MHKWTAPALRPGTCLDSAASARILPPGCRFCVYARQSSSCSHLPLAFARRAGASGSGVILRWAICNNCIAVTACGWQGSVTPLVAAICHVGSFQRLFVANMSQIVGGQGLVVRKTRCSYPQQSAMDAVHKNALRHLHESLIYPSFQSGLALGLAGVFWRVFVEAFDRASMMTRKGLQNVFCRFDDDPLLGLFKR